MIAGLKHGRSSAACTKAARRSRKGALGQSLVEFALVFPVFMLILAGILDFGFMLYSRMTVINGAREGARVAVPAINNPYGIPAMVDSTVRSVATGLNLADLPTVVPVCVAASGHPACDFLAGAAAADPQSGDSIKVTVTYTYRSFFPLFFGSTFNLSSSVQMVLE